MLGNLKTALKGTYHAIDHAQYAHCYLAEFAYRFNRHFDLPAMAPRQPRAAVTTKPHSRHVLMVSE
ncbi:MAG: transposase [Burkholderia sp.]